MEKSTQMRDWKTQILSSAFSKRILMNHEAHSYSVQLQSVLQGLSALFRINVVLNQLSEKLTVHIPLKHCVLYNTLFVGCELHFKPPTPTTFGENLSQLK